MDRVLYVIADLDPFGPGEQAALMAFHLRDRMEIDFFCCSCRDSNSSLRETANRYQAYELGKRNWLGAAQKLGRMLRQNKYDLVHTWDCRSTLLMSLAALAQSGQRRRTPWVRQAHADAPRSPIADPTWFPGLRKPDWNLGDRSILGTYGATEKQIAVSLAFPASIEKPNSSRLPLPQRSLKIIGTVCPLEAWTGVKHLIWSLDQIKCVRDDLRLIIWGSGSQAAQLKYYARKVTVHDWIQWRSPSRNVRAEMAELDIYWHAPRTEGTSPALVDALLHGLPAIAPRTIANNELAATWLSTLVTVPWGARDEIARQTQQWLLHGFTPMSETAVSDWIRWHSPARVAEEYTAAYDRILGR